jgi:hypothetical protein
VHFKQIDNTAKAALHTDRDLNPQRIRIESLPYHSDGAVEIGTDTIHFVNVANAWYLVAVGLPPHCF